MCSDRRAKAGMVEQQQEGEAGKGGRQECERPCPVLIHPGKAGGTTAWGLPASWPNWEERLRDGLGTRALTGPETRPPLGWERSDEDGEAGADPDGGLGSATGGATLPPPQQHADPSPTAPDPPPRGAAGRRAQRLIHLPTRSRSDKHQEAGGEERAGGWGLRCSTPSRLTPATQAAMVQWGARDPPQGFTPQNLPQGRG